MTILSSTWVENLFPPRTSQMIKLQAEKIYNEIKNHFGDILDTDYEIEEELIASQEIDRMWDRLQSNVNEHQRFLFNLSKRARAGTRCCSHLSRTYRQGQAFWISNLAQ